MSSCAKVRQKETKMWREIHFSNNNNFNSFLLENIPNSKWKSSRYGLSRLRLVNMNVRRAVIAPTAASQGPCGPCLPLAERRGCLDVLLGR